MRTRIALFAASVTLLLGISRKSDTHVPRPEIDTPRYRYFTVIDLPPNVISRSLYVMDSIMGQWGIEQGGTQIKKAFELYNKERNYIWDRARLDSELIKTKIVKP